MTWIRYFTKNMFTCSPQEKIIVEFIKKDPIQKLRFIPNDVLLPEWSTVVLFCLVVLFMSPLFVLNSYTSCCSSEKSFSSHKFFGFPAFLCIWNLSNNDCIVFEIHLFTPRTTKGLFCNYYRRFKRSLMLQKEKSCIKSNGVKTFWIWRSG